VDPAVSFVESYLRVNGHLTVAGDVKRVLAHRPDVAGIGVAGMPAVPQGYTVASFTGDGATSVYARH